MSDFAISAGKVRRRRPFGLAERWAVHCLGLLASTFLWVVWSFRREFWFSFATGLLLLTFQTSKRFTLSPYLAIHILRKYFAGEDNDVKTSTLLKMKEDIGQIRFSMGFQAVALSLIELGIL